MKLRFLGTAQDGGIPQAGCSCDNCLTHRRTVASIALLSDSEAIVIDITPDFRRQWSELSNLYRVKFKAAFLTHAHWGHYGGLPMLGKEAWNIKELPLYVSPRFSKFIQSNEPFRTLVTNGNIFIHEIIADEDNKFNISAINVPHRQDFTDTYAFKFELNGKRVIYIPCVDYFDDEMINTIRSHDLAILDGTFYSDNELPNRDINKIPHPRVKDTMSKLKDVADKIIFTHMNHSNPIVDPLNKFRLELETDGFRVAEDGLEIE